MQLDKDFYSNMWTGAGEHGKVVVKKLGRRSFTVHSDVGSGQFDNKKKAFTAAMEAGDKGVSPNDNEFNLARLGHYDH